MLCCRDPPLISPQRRMFPWTLGSPNQAQPKLSRAGIQPGWPEREFREHLISSTSTTRSVLATSTFK